MQLDDKSLNAALKIRSTARQRARTDLLWLCNEILGYKDVCKSVHGPIIDKLQKFKGGTDTIVNGAIEYTPACKINELDGSRRTLILYPRFHLKTTLVTIAHSLQWVINYPDIRVLLSFSTGEIGEKVIRELKAHFQFNKYFRAVFPDFCPPAEKAGDFGSRDEFIVPARRLHRKEPTIWMCTVGKTIAGVHPDVIFNSDLVDKENIKTPGGINDVISHFRYLNPLLERYEGVNGSGPTTGWMYVEGTKYDFGDLHSTIEKAPDWDNKVVAGAHNEDYSQILWPSRNSKETLQTMQREMGDWAYSAQMLNKCVPQGDGLCDPKDIAFVKTEVVSALKPTLRLHCTIDLAGMEQTRSGDYTVLTVGGFDRDGRLYILDIRCGHFAPELVIEHIFDIHRRYPSIIDYKIEKEAHARVLLPFLQREMSKRQSFPVLWPIKRDTHTSKQHRIRGLRPWFKTGIIRFNDGLTLAAKNELMDEVAQFPSQSSGVHDDILDTLADMMQNRDGGVTDDVIADSPDLHLRQFGMNKMQDRFLGFDESGVAQWLYGGDSSGNQYNPTGIL